MSRMIHYKVKELTQHGLTKIEAEDFNDMIGGSGPLPKQGIELLKRKLGRLHNVEEDKVIICNMFDVGE